MVLPHYQNNATEHAEQCVHWENKKWTGEKITLE